MWLIPLFDSHGINLVLTRMYLGPDSWRTSQIPFKTFTAAQRMIRCSMFVLLVCYIITMNANKKYLKGGIAFFLFFIRAKLSASWICGRRMVCLTWTSFSLWWIWPMESLYLPLHWKVEKWILFYLGNVWMFVTMHCVLPESKGQWGCNFSNVWWTACNDIMQRHNIFLVSKQFPLTPTERHSLLSLVPQLCLLFPSYPVLMP